MNKRKQRIMLVGVFALFFVPIVLALVLRLNPALLGTVNKGVLIEPPRELNSAGLKVLMTPYPDVPLLRETWSVLTLSNGTCDEKCSQNLYATRQARTAVNKDYDRVRRVLVVTETLTSENLEKLKAAHPDLTVVVTAAAWLDAVRIGITKAADTYIVDPRGYLFISYPVPTQSSDLLKDLKRLLKISAVG